MFRILIDTCVWLDLAKDHKQAPVLDVIDQMLLLGMLDLIVPRIVLEEFERNRERILKESTRSLSTHLRAVKEAVETIGSDKKKTRLMLSHLDDVGHKIPLIGGKAAGTITRIEKLLRESEVLEASEAVMLRAAERAVRKQAPFHRGKNAMADAVLVELYAECVRAKTSQGVRFAFVTHNKSDFSFENGNQKLPHADLASFFSRIKSLYFINLPEALRRVEPTLVTDIMIEQAWEHEPRGLTEILEAENLLFNQVWYNRHWNRRIAVEEGKIKIVEKVTYPRPPGSPEVIQRDVWKRAKASARKAERRFGKKNLGPWDDFEWGMVNGKLSALRWVLGDEWNMLDT
jgi:hypothetical protein